MATKYSSSSSVSKAGSIRDMPCFTIDPQSDRFGATGPEVETYNLIDIAKALKVNYTSIIQRGTQVNDDIAAACVRKICTTKIGATDWEVVANKELTVLNNLSPLLWSINQRPDVAIKHEQAVGFTAEVRSSPMLNTEMKATFGAVDLLRHIRNQGNTNVNSTVSFAFPNCSSNHCLIQITVTFRNFRFNVKMVRYTDLTVGIEMLCKVIKEQCRHFFQLRSDSCVSKFLIRLSPDECNALCDGGIQLQSSRHVMVATSEFVYKVIYVYPDIQSHYKVTGVLSNKGLVNQEFIIYPEPLYQMQVCTFRYKNVKYLPMNAAEAHCCLKELVIGIATALTKLHDILLLSHNDVRLPNICFNESYHPVLIDIDRCHSVEDLHPMFASDVSSCMYTIPKEFVDGKKTDFFQLGWMVVQVVNLKENFHSRKWEDEPEEIRENKFIKKLIKHGDYDENLINYLPSGDETIKDVLQRREQMSYECTENVPLNPCKRPKFI